MYHVIEYAPREFQGVKEVSDDLKKVRKEFRDDLQEVWDDLEKDIWESGSIEHPRH
jgi:hypothetical protein